MRRTTVHGTTTQGIVTRGASDLPLGGMQGKCEDLRIQRTRKVVQEKRLYEAVRKEAKLVILEGGAQGFVLSLPSTLRLRCYSPRVTFMEPRGKHKERDPLGQKETRKEKERYYC